MNKLTHRKSFPQKNTEITYQYLTRNRKNNKKQ